MCPLPNVLELSFKLHLRLDQVAKVWLVEKPTRRGPAQSFEAFDTDGGLILQIYGYRKYGEKDVAAFFAMTEELKRASSN